MKIWIKYLLGAFIGIIIGIYLPEYGGESGEVLSFISRAVISVGRYILFPLILFSLVMGTFELRKDGSLGTVYLRYILYIVLFTMVLIFLGALTVFILSPGRIPIIIEEEARLMTPDIGNFIFRVFPKNLFLIFSENGDFLLPLVLLSFILGFHFHFDKDITTPVIQFFDSMSRVLYRINNFFVEVLSIGMIALASLFIINIRSIIDMGLFRQLFTILIIDSLIVLFVIVPIVLFTAGGKSRPMKWLYGIIAPLVIAFFSGDVFFSLGVLKKHGKESLGIPRRINSSGFTLTAMFGRAGTALVTCVAFIFILKSYSSLEITFYQFGWVMLYTFLISFLLSTFPGTGAIAGISILCTFYGKGLEEGFLLLWPIAAILVSIGAALDIVIAAIITTLVAEKEGVRKDIKIAKFC
jgi:aerobic C4-dicarboxylate transport protein